MGQRAAVSQCFTNTKHSGPSKREREPVVSGLWVEIWQDLI
jgi:hypothetical protein